MSFATAPSDNRLVVIILRGGMDGLDVLQPTGDKNFAALRSTLGVGRPDAPLPLENMYALHASLEPLMPLWRAGELGFANAVSTPYRNKRSHFDGQDYLEAGTTVSAQAPQRDGWLNRYLQTLPNLEAETAFSVGADEMMLLRGNAEVAQWSPSTRLEISEQTKRLMALSYHDDPLFADTFDEALRLANYTNIGSEIESYDDMLSSMAEAMNDGRKLGGYDDLARFTAGRLREETRIASFSINGWDTHRNQRASLGKSLRSLSDVILTLKTELGPVWGATTVIAMTEFGRTARENGSGGTDHGTGGLAILAGGAVHGGKVYGDWPGLSDGDLYQERDLMPTQDVRAYAAMALRGMFGTQKSVLEQSIFPGLDMSGVGSITR
jgi:uncharacterized protein (DUF1501 family)